MKIAIIGGGASGMMAAITAGQDHEVTIYERNERIGKKLLATGNGKCNFSNKNFSMDAYYQRYTDQLQQIFQGFSVEDTIHFFEQEGMLIKDREGYLYPFSEQASTVLDLLRMKLQECHVRLCTDTEVTAVSRTDRGFLVNGKESYDRLILSCGSPASWKKETKFWGYQLAEKLGHTIQLVVPSLVQLRSGEPYFKSIAGVRCQAVLQLYADQKLIQEEGGELQLTEYGLSGIPTFQLSRMAAYALHNKQNVCVSVNFLPHIRMEELEQNIKKRYEYQKQKTLEEFFTGLCNKKINLWLIKQVGYRPSTLTGELTLHQIYALAASYQQVRIPIQAANPLENAQVCAGGVCMDEVNSRMESRLVPGLYFTGELLDVDGKCGGYNLQWAWTSGYLAGKYAAGRSDRMED